MESLRTKTMGVDTRPWTQSEKALPVFQLALADVTNLHGKHLKTRAGGKHGGCPNHTTPGYMQHKLPGHMYVYMAICIFHLGPEPAELLPAIAPPLPAALLCTRFSPLLPIHRLKGGL